ncbi:hypothetical protein, partial [Weissella fermenti]
MKLTKLFKKSSTKSADSGLLIDDQFQISLSDPGVLKKQLAHFNKMCEDEDDQSLLASVGFTKPFSATKPYLTLLAFDNVFKLSLADDTLTDQQGAIEAELIEYDYPQTGQINKVVE